MPRDRNGWVSGDGPRNADVRRELKAMASEHPDPAAAQQAVTRVLAGLEPGGGAVPLSGSRQNWTLWRWKMKTVMAAVLALAAGVWFVAGGGGVTTPVWADVVKQSAGFKTAKLMMRGYEGDRLVGMEEIWVAWPGAIRTLEYDVASDPPAPVKGSISTPESAVEWNLITGLSEVVGSDDPYVVQSDAARNLLALLGVASAVTAVEPDIRVDGEATVFVPVVGQHPVDAQLRGFRLARADGAPLDNDLLEAVVYWFSSEKNVVVRIGSERPAAGDRWREAEVVFDPDPKIVRRGKDAVGD